MSSGGKDLSIYIYIYLYMYIYISIYLYIHMVDAKSIHEGPAPVSTFSVVSPAHHVVRSP